MTIWTVHNRLEQPNAAATIANQKRNKSLPLSSAIESTFTNRASHAAQRVEWPSPSMHVIALKLSHCWRLILYAIIIITVISRTPPHVNANSNNNANVPGRVAAKTLPTPAASTWSSNFFDADRIQCPSFVDNSACPCYKFEDGKWISVRFWHMYADAHIVYSFINSCSGWMAFASFLSTTSFHSCYTCGYLFSAFSLKNHIHAMLCFNVATVLDHVYA